MSTQLTVKAFDPIQERFLSLAPKETFEKETAFAIQLLNKNSYMNGATTTSKLQAVFNVALTGLTLNPTLKLAYLVPRYNNASRELEVHLEPSYQGLVKLVTDTGSAKSVSSQVVFEGDEFDVVLGTDTQIIHRPKFKSETIQLVYAVATLSDGSKMVEVMTLLQINDIRETSESYKAFKAGKSKSCIWESHYSEMARKTVVKRLVKSLPKTDMWDKLGEAIEIDNSDFKASYEQLDYINSLLDSANITPEQSESYYRELNIMTSTRASKVIEYLKENQTDPISAGRNYGQTEIKNKIDQEI